MKIFGIGFHKTGTSSLKEALQILGFSVRGAFGNDRPDISEKAWDMARRLIPRYDAFEDNPWPLLYELLDQHYDDSKFILTVRDPDSWIKSVTKHFSGYETPMRQWIYGYGDPAGHEALYLDRYHRHNQEVIEHFSGREGKDFLILRLTEGEGWEKLCPFLGVESPGDIPIPHRNRAKQREAKSRIVQRVRRKLISAKDSCIDRIIS